MKPRLRAPFVVTVAIMASIGAGCSSKQGNEVSNPPPADAGSDTSEAGGFDVRDEDATINPAECPAIDPGLGAAHRPCTAAASVRCAYQDLCPQHPADQMENVYACHDDGTGDHWTLVSKDYVPSCPTSEPKTGDPCPCTIHMGFVACNFGLCENFTRTYAACKGVDTFESTWKVTPIACNPPEVDGGDAGDAGDATDGG